jgi:Bacterial conjugation TrbI-like protein
MNLQQQPGYSGNLRVEDSGDLSTLFNIDLKREESTITGELIPITAGDLATREAVGDEEAQIPTHQNPLIKGGVVVASISTLVGVAAYLYLQGNQPQTIATKPTSTPTPQLFDNAIVEGGDVKGELALSKQQQELNLVAANKPKETVTPNPNLAAKQLTPPPATNSAAIQSTPPAATTKPTPPAKVAASPILTQPVKPTYYAPPIAASPILTRPTAPNTLARVEPIRSTNNIPKIRLTRTVKPTTTAVAARTVTQSQPISSKILATNPKSPILQPTAPTGYSKTPGGIYQPATKPNPPAPLSWQLQATAGTFGGRFGKGGATVAATTVVAANPPAPAGAQNPPPQPLASEQYVITQSTAPQARIILPGAKASGQILNPIQLAANDAQGQTILISLFQPLTSTDGKMVLPAGATQIAFKINALDNGWIRGVSDKVYLNGQELAVPAGSFALTAQTGEPLVARLMQFGNSEIDAQNRTSFVYGALKNVGAVLTQPDTQSTVSSGVGGFTSSSSSQSKPNILGAVLQGGFNPLAQQQTQRSEAEVQQLLKATRLWFLPQGTNVQISVNQPLTLSLP